MDIPAEQGLLFLKPALAGNTLATKLITLMPRNAERGLPTLLATIVLTDPVTGRTVAVMEGTWITELRTAAASAVAADALTPPGPKIVAMLGSGALAQPCARLARDPAGERAAYLEPRPGERCALREGHRRYTFLGAEAAVRGADIVCTVTSAMEPVLKGAWLKPGAFVAAVGAPRPTWRELDDEAMRNVIVVDSRDSALHESGDVILSKAEIYAEIGEILAGAKPPPPHGTTVIFKSLGQAVEDAVAAGLVFEAWRKRAAPDRRRHRRRRCHGRLGRVLADLHAARPGGGTGGARSQLRAPPRRSRRARSVSSSPRR